MPKLLGRVTAACVASSNATACRHAAGSGGVPKPKLSWPIMGPAAAARVQSVRGLKSVAPRCCWSGALAPPLRCCAMPVNGERFAAGSAGQRPWSTVPHATAFLEVTHRQDYWAWQSQTDLFIAGLITRWVDNQFWGTERADWNSIWKMKLCNQQLNTWNQCRIWCSLMHHLRATASGC